MGNALLMFFAGGFLGFLLGLCFIVILLRWSLRKKDMLSALIKEIYHVDLLPFICRIEGLISLALMEWRLGTGNPVVYIELAFKEIKKLKEQVTAAVKK